MDTIHVAFCVHDENGDYIQHTAVAMTSVFCNTKSLVRIHMIHDDTLRISQKEILNALVREYHQTIEYHQVDKKIFTDIAMKLKYATQRNFSIGTLFRLAITDILSIDKVIYLDSDIIVNQDIQALWSIDSSDFYIAAVRDLKDTRKKWINQYHFYRMGVSSDFYFNAGVILFNLKKIRNNFDLLASTIDFLLQHSKNAIFFDQDALNGLLQKKTLFLSKKYNFIPVALTPGKYDDDLQAIIHFAGPKPWKFRCSQFDWLYWKYLSKTPWGDSMPKLMEKQRHIYIDLGYALYTGKIGSRRMFIKGLAYQLKKLILGKL